MSNPKNPRYKSPSIPALQSQPEEEEIPSPPSGREGIPQTTEHPHSLANSGVLAPASHTPTPWFIGGDATILADVCIPVAVCDFFRKGREPVRTECAANAAHIVRCVNSFDDLLAVCKHALESAEWAAEGCGNTALGRCWGSLAGELRAAIAKAEGRQP